MTDYSELVKALRCCTQNPPETCVGCTYNIGNNECAVRGMMCDAASAIEALLSKRVEIVRCRECKYWSEVDTSDGLRYGQCDRPDSAIRGTCFIRESWFCADGERREA
jgi:hypothetical protein